MESASAEDDDELDPEWLGYFIPGTRVLKNLVGATTTHDLARAENDLVEWRLFEVLDSPSIIDRTYDLNCLRAIHLQLFQDVYEWAGEVRTVGIQKDGERFCTPPEIERAMLFVSSTLFDTENLAKVRIDRIPRVLAELYDYTNFAHPFREGNGRATRVFFDMLLAERGLGLDWLKPDDDALNRACHLARAKQDRTGLQALFELILDEDPAYEF